MSAWRWRPRRPEHDALALLSAGAGCAFGVSAVLTKAFVHYLGQGPLAWVPHWEPYGLAVSSIGGLLLAQSAFQTGALAAAVGAEQVLQPLAGVVLGVALLGENVSPADPLQRLAAVLALAAMLGSVVILARVEHPEGALEPDGSTIDLDPTSPNPIHRST